jgi:hypothetical protein
MMSTRKSAGFLVSFFGVMIALVFTLPPFSQAPNYHHFALDRPLFGIPNFWNVISNLAFVIVAALAWRDPNRARTPSAAVFRVGVLLTAIGSAYYHWAPSNDTLFWDRLPMTIAFSGVVAALVEKRVNPQAGRRMLWPLVIASAASVVYWRLRGNLIPYGIVQFGTVLLVLLILLIFPRKGREQRLLWLALIAYVAAKLLEAFDQPIGRAIQLMGGHPIKHVAAALGCWFINAALFASSERLTSPHEPN